MLRATVAAVIGAAAGYAIAKQTRSDPRLGAMIGAFAGGGIVLLAETYGKSLLEQNSGYALGAARQLNSDLDYDIVQQQQREIALREKHATVRSAIAQNKNSLVENSTRLMDLTQVLEREDREFRDIYKPAPAVYTQTVAFVTAKGTQTPSDTPAVKSEVSRSSTSISKLEKANATVMEEIVRTATLLKDHGIYHKL